MEIQIGEIAVAYDVVDSMTKMAPFNNSAFLIGGPSLHSKHEFNLSVTEKIEK